MDIKALKHLANAAQAIAGSRKILVFGSASLFGMCFASIRMDMAVVKLMVGRPKDIALLAELARQQRLDLARVGALLGKTPMVEAMIVKTNRILSEVHRAAGLDPG